MSIKEKKQNEHVLADAQSLKEDENGGQDHCYSEDETAGHIPGESEHKGEAVQRTEKSSTVTAGRHITSAKDGLAIAKERSAGIEANRKASAKLFDSKRLSVVPERKGRK